MFILTSQDDFSEAKKKKKFLEGKEINVPETWLITHSDRLIFFNLSNISH